MSCVSLRSQIGSGYSYRFLDLPASARAAGNGGSSMPLWGSDVNLLFSNPAALNPSMTKQSSFNYCNFVGDLNYFTLAYAQHLQKAGTAGISLQSFSYGSFKAYDELGTELGNFKATDYAVNLHFAKPLADSLFNIGATFKTIISQYDVYSSFGNALDFGIMYHGKNDLSMSLMARNIGVVYKSYVPGSANERILNDVQFGISKKVAKAPFRPFLVYDQLLRWKIGYVSPIDTAGKSGGLNNSTEQDTTNFRRLMIKSGKFTDSFMRHVTIGTEIVITQQFALRIAYNYRRQKEMTLPDKRGASAFSFGFNLSVKRFGFAYSFAKMSVPGNSHLIGISLGF